MDAQENPVLLPHLGEGLDSGDVVAIYVAAGDLVAVDQEIVEVESDKATIPIKSPSAGTVSTILVAVGDTVQVGAPLLILREAAGSAPL